MRGSFAMLSAKEHYGMLFAPFCPYHAHVGHAGECPKWRNSSHGSSHGCQWRARGAKRPTTTTFLLLPLASAGDAPKPAAADPKPIPNVRRSVRCNANADADGRSAASTSDSFIVIWLTQIARSIRGPWQPPAPAAPHGAR